MDARFIGLPYLAPLRFLQETSAQETTADRKRGRFLPLSSLELK